MQKKQLTVSDLHPADYNPRKITDKQLSLLSKSMAEFGDLSGVVVNITTGNIVGGHQRVKTIDPDCAIEKHSAIDETGTVAEGEIITPSGKIKYREVDWPEEKEKAANLAANKHGGQWDLEKLNVVMTDLKSIDYDIELTGFDIPEINRLEKHINEGGDGDPNLDGFVYQVVVTVCDDNEQSKLIQELEKRGLKCQPLML